MWKNRDGSTSYSRPKRIRLSDGLTRTNEDITDDLLEETGWYWENDPVEIISTSTQSGEVL